MWRSTKRSSSSTEIRTLLPIRVARSSPRLSSAYIAVRPIRSRSCASDGVSKSTKGFLRFWIRRDRHRPPSTWEYRPVRFSDTLSIVSESFAIEGAAAISARAIETAYGLPLTAAAEFPVAEGGYSARRVVGVDLRIPLREDLRQFDDLAGVAYALKHAERLRRWVEAIGWPAGVGILVEAQSEAARHRSVSPLDDPSLLDEFLRLHEATVGRSRDQAIGRFASSWGFLGLPAIVSIDGRDVRAELLDEWSAEVEQLVKLNTLSERLWQSRLDSKHWGHVEATSYLRSKFGEHPLSELRQQAEATIRSAVNLRLRGEIELGISTKGRLTWVPSSLLATLYLRFASRVLGATPRTRGCAWCGRPIWPDESRKRQFCSDACRSKNWRAAHSKDKASK